MHLHADTHCRAVSQPWCPLPIGQNQEDCARLNEANGNTQNTIVLCCPTGTVCPRRGEPPAVLPEERRPAGPRVPLRALSWGSSACAPSTPSATPETGLCYISQTEPGPDRLGRCEPEPHPEHLVGQTCSPHPTGGMSPAEPRGRAQSLANPDERSCQLSLGPESLLEGGWGGARPSRLLSSAHFPSGDKEHGASMWKEGNERRLRTGHEPICFKGRANKRPLPDRTRLSHARPPGLRSRARGCQHSGDLAVGNSAASRGAPVNPQTRIPVETKPAQPSWTTRDAGGGDEKQEGDLGPQATARPASQDLRAADVRRRSPGTSSGLAHALTSSPGDTRRTPGLSAGRGSHTGPAPRLPSEEA